jgi:multiple sugar transport system substrate-binding protein
MKKKLPGFPMLKIILLAMVFLFLGGCSPGKQEIEFVFMQRNDATGEYWKKVASDFEAANPDVKVNLHILTWDEGPDTIEKMVKEGNPPDIIHVATRELGGYIARGWVEPLDGYMTPEFKSGFYPKILNASAQYEGRTFGLPVSVTTRGLYYNKELFARAGISEPPQNWQELREAALKISQLGPDTYGLGVIGNGKETDLYFYYFLVGNGGSMLTPDGTRAAFNRDEGVESLVFLQEMIRDGAIPDPSLYKKNDLRAAFRSGQLGMVIDSDSLSDSLTRDGNLFEYGIVAVPFEVTEEIVSVTDSLSLFSLSENKVVAWEFLEFIYQDQYRLEYALHEGYLPEKITVAAQIQMSGQARFFLEQLPRASFVQTNVKSIEIEQIISQALTDAYLGKLDAKTALDNAAAKINELLSYSATSW